MTVRYSLDLHVHSVYSDGLLSPDALCAQADKRGVTVLALCDHDVLDGLEPMAEAVSRRNQRRPQNPPIHLLPAIELSSGAGGRTHVLGYGANPKSDVLRAGLAAARADRQERAQRILTKLREAGVRLLPQALAELDAPAVGRAHIARALIKSGVVHTVTQAFQRYLAEGKSCYVPRKGLPATEAVRFLKSANAVPVLAHPLRLGMNEQELYMLLQPLREAGLQGIEVYHPSADSAGAAWLLQVARRNGLLVTGGSDFHGDAASRVRLGSMPAGWTAWREDLAALEAAVANAAQHTAANLTAGAAPNAAHPRPGA